MSAAAGGAGSILMAVEELLVVRFLIRLKAGQIMGRVVGTPDRLRDLGHVTETKRVRERRHRAGRGLVSLTLRRDPVT